MDNILIATLFHLIFAEFVLIFTAFEEMLAEFVLILPRLVWIAAELARPVVKVLLTAKF